MRLKQDESALKRESILIHFIASNEVMSAVEYTVTKSDNTKEAVSVEEIHGNVMLKKRKEASVDTCVERCHKQGASHPVGVAARGNIRIPDNLPTADGKIITCITCHMPHGSKERYLARLDFERNICVLCHLDRL